MSSKKYKPSGSGKKKRKSKAKADFSKAVQGSSIREDAIPKHKSKMKSRHRSDDSRHPLSRSRGSDSGSSPGGLAFIGKPKGGGGSKRTALSHRSIPTTSSKSSQSNPLSKPGEESSEDQQVSLLGKAGRKTKGGINAEEEDEVMGSYAPSIMDEKQLDREDVLQPHTFKKFRPDNTSSLEFNEGELFLFQLPSDLPFVKQADPPKEIIPGSGPGSGSGSSSEGPLKAEPATSSSEGSFTLHEKNTTFDESDRYWKSFHQERSKTAQLLNYKPGQIGTIERYSSGKVLFRMGELVYDITPGFKPYFGRELLQLDLQGPHGFFHEMSNKTLITSLNVEESFKNLDRSQDHVD